MTYWEIVEYIDKALEGFDHDPADSDYQQGYEAALRELRRVISES